MLEVSLLAIYKHNKKPALVFRMLSCNYMSAGVDPIDFVLDFDYYNCKKLRLIAFHAKH